MKKAILCILSAFVFIIITEAFQTAQQQPWVVPEKNTKMANPVKADAKSIAAGKALFTKNCVDCHGKKGLGDGSKVPELKTTPADMTSQAFQSQTDGSLFYKIAEGRKDMPKFKKDLPEDEDRWNLVNYVRSFGAKK
ncbi:MAG: cytochrome c [Bacteroidota bacterium]